MKAAQPRSAPGLCGHPGQLPSRQKQAMHHRKGAPILDGDTQRAPPVIPTQVMGTGSSLQTRHVLRPAAVVGRCMQTCACSR